MDYIQEIEWIMAYGVLATPALVIDEKVVMTGHRGLSKIELILRDAVDAPIS